MLEEEETLIETLSLLIKQAFHVSRLTTNANVPVSRGRRRVP